MRNSKLTLLSFVIFFCAVVGYAQSPWTFSLNTGNNGSIIIPFASVTANGASLVSGDWIGAFTPAGVCCGAIQSDGSSNMGLIVWGDDDQTTNVIEGIQPGQVISYRIWKTATATEIQNVTVTYQTPFNGQYAVNCLGYVTAMTGTTIVNYTVSGQITYHNTAGTVMTNCTVNLMQGTAVIATTTTTSTGNYTFANVPNGNYTIVATTTKAKVGMNTQDVTNLKQRLAFQITYDALQNKAADVNQSNSVNTQDVTLIKQKLAFQTPPTWTIPDYVFENPAITVNGANFISNFKSLCSGDVNGSGVPAL